MKLILKIKENLKFKVVTFGSRDQSDVTTLNLRFSFIFKIRENLKFLFMEVYIMRVLISIILMVIAALVGFFFGAGMNEAMGGAILLSMITGFACTINAIEKNKKD